MHFAQQLLNPANVSLVVIFIRDTPRCSYCDEAKEWIQENLSHATCITYSMSKNPVEWREFRKKYPKAKSVPQIEVTMKNESRLYIGGAGDLTRAFSSQTEESF